MDRTEVNLKQVVKKYIAALEKRGVKPEQIILYGSFAQGQPHAGSDIDLVVISSDLSKMQPLEKLEFLSLAAGDVDAPIEALGYTPEAINKRGKNSIFWDIVQQTGRVVYRK